MTTAMTVEFNTTYNGSGTQGMKNGMSEVENSVEKVEGSSDRLVYKLERPIGRIAYGGLAEAALGAAGANEKLDGVTGKLEQSFHVLGSSLLFVEPELGFLALGAAALVTLFVKLSNSIEINSDNVKKNVVEFRNQSEEYKKSADLLEKQNVITKEQAEILRQGASAKEQDIKKLKESIDSKIKDAEAEKQRFLAIEKTRDEEDKLYGGSIHVGKRGSAQVQEKINELTYVYSALLPEAKRNQDEMTKSIEQHYKALGEEAEAQARVLSEAKERKDFQGVNKQVLEDLASSEKEVAGLTQQLNNAKTDSDKAELNAHMEYLMKRIAADKTILSEEKDIQKQRESGILELGKSLVSESGRFMHDLVEGNLSSLKTDVANFAWAQSEKLFVQAVADSFDPIRAFLAPEEFAASAGLAVLGSALGSSNTTANPASGSGSLGSSSGSALSSSQQPGQATLTFNINGGVIDKPTIAYMMGEMNKLVQQNGFPLVATKINGVTPMPGA